jgi:DNA invertase Pin-like site-specific DNA recombinase
VTLYGYARVSTIDQDLTLQEQALRAAGCRVVRAEKRSGAAREGRAELRLLLDFLRRGDTRADAWPTHEISRLNRDGVTG